MMKLLVIEDVPTLSSLGHKFQREKCKLFKKNKNRFVEQKQL